MRVQPTELPDVVLIEPEVHGDARGFFLETYHEHRYQAAGIGCRFVQDNLSRSRKGVLRGLHYQLHRPQAKLVQVIRGEVFDVAVDLRRDSPTFGRWVGVRLSEQNHAQLFIPVGFAHGFYVLSDVADLHYKCSDVYDPQSERTLLWNDPALGIQWPLAGEPIVSEKDQQGRPLAEAECFPPPAENS